MRIRIALTLGALVLAGGALTGGIAMATQAPAPVPTASVAPSARPAPAEPPRATKAPGPASVRPGAPRVPKAVPAGPVGDLALPAIGETR